MKPGRDYYAGGARVVIEGVPIRLARKPSAANLAWSRQWEKYLNSDASDYLNRAERAQARTQAAKRAIELYAEMLEITVTRAKAIIERQRLHVLANPVRDLSLEYDL